MTAESPRILLPADPFTRADGPWQVSAEWPASWIHVDEPSAPWSVAGYVLRFSAGGEVRVHVSADERYELLCDGERVGRGPDRGDLDHWRFESYRLRLDEGEHVLAARVWALGEDAPYAQLSLGPAFLLASDTHPGLATGVAEWRASELPGYALLPKGAAWGTGAKTLLDGRAHPWGWERGDAASWPRAVTGPRALSAELATDRPPARLLTPTILPAQEELIRSGAVVRHAAEWSGGDTTGTPVRAAESDADEVARWQSLLDGSALTVAPFTRRRVVVDLDDYVCAYPEVSLDGGRDARVRIHWQESLVEPDGGKGDRDGIEGKLFRTPGPAGDVPVGDEVIAGGGRQRSTPLWWEAGRYVEILVETAASPLTISGIRFLETRYPYRDASTFDSDVPGLDDVRRISFRTLQACSHETTVDCPFYEQLQYAGDARTQCLAAYAVTDDDRLARQAILAFDRSRDSRGITTSRYPSAIRQHIPGFSLWWVGMVHDFLMWRGDRAFVRDRMRGVRAVMDAFEARIDDDGLLRPLPGWNFLDWVDGWESGSPPGSQWEPSSVGTLQLSHIAELAAELEDHVGDPERAAVDRRIARRTREAAEAAFWDAGRGLYADDLAHTSWSEHAQVLAVLAGASEAATALQRALDGDVARCSVYFTHYLFEALFRLGRGEEIVARLDPWNELVDRGLRTVIEKPEPSRSDCHAWGAHPLHHFVASVAGIRPTAPGMERVDVQARLEGIGRLAMTVPTPRGPLEWEFSGGELTVVAPEGVEVTRV